MRARRSRACGDARAAIRRGALQESGEHGCIGPLAQRSEVGILLRVSGIAPSAVNGAREVGLVRVKYWFWGGMSA